ncbi:MAG: hypothetical protein MUP39_02525 [Wolbachia endosymbiont of Homalodisca vitripennis]|nr:hypothetical protein [Wolbachia endosymbiont of Homalodisca vitripennis]
MTISVANGVMKVADTGIHSSFFLDSSVTHWNDKRELLVRHVIPALDAGIQMKNQSGMTKRERILRSLFAN